MKGHGARLLFFLTMYGALTATSCSYNGLTATTEEGQAPADLAAPIDSAAQAASKPATPPQQLPAKSQFVGEVLDVHDGSTLTVMIGGMRERVRLIGVDAPELHQAPWGLDAFLMLRRLVMGKIATVETDTMVRDRGNQLLAYVYVDGAFVNVELIRSGRVQMSVAPPNVLHLTEYKQAQAQAQRAGIGLWDPQDPRVPNLKCVRTQHTTC